MSRKIAMKPDQAPQQRIHLVVDLPPRPKSFKSRCGKELYSLSSIRELPLENRPRQMPRSAQFVGTIEWAWSPMHSRIDAYYLSTNRKRSHWFLWASCLDDSDDYRWKWETTLFAYGTKKGIDKKTAIIHLLIDAWNYEREFMELDAFHIINAVGVLSIGEFWAIDRAVWPEE